MKYLAAIGLLAATPATAEVVSASPNGFEVRETVTLVVPADAAFASFSDIAAWWDPEHTYSGDSRNLSLNLNPGGCFCERFAKGGGIEHMHVTYLEPGKRIVFTGALGPLLYEATSGVMNVEIKTAAGGSQLTLDYRAAGFFNGGAEKLAPQVDEVLAGQLKRLRTYAAGRPRT
jgi:uncharacterized protein YndB with AHSA1/START domain